MNIKIFLFSLLTTIAIAHIIEFIRVEIIFKRYKRILDNVGKYNIICIFNKKKPILKIEDLSFKIYAYDISNWGRDIVDWNKYKEVKKFLKVLNIK